MLMLKSFIKYP